MDYLRAFKMVVVGTRAFSLNALAVFELDLDGWVLKTNTGEIFNVSKEEAKLFKNELVKPTLIIQPNDPFGFLRGGLNWLPIGQRAINLNSIVAVEEQSPPYNGCYQVSLFGGWQVMLNPMEVQLFGKECKDVIFEIQKLAGQLPRH